MKTYKIIALSAVLAAATWPFHLQANAQEARSGELDAAAYRATVEDIEIMRRVLEKEVQGLLEERGLAHSGGKLLTGYSVSDGDKKDQGDVTTMFKSNIFGGYVGGFWLTRFDSKGLYVPGSGAVFTLEVAVPAHSVPIDREKEGDGDVWEQTEKEMKQGFSLDRMKKEKDKKYALDAAAMDAVIDRLVETAARNGLNIEHLAESDRITMIVTFKGETSLQKAAEYTGDAALAQAYTMMVVSKASLSEDVIIQVPMSSLLARQRQGGDYSAVKGAARILRFREKDDDAKKAW